MTFELLRISLVLQIDKYPIPKPEDLLTALASGQKFSKFSKISTKLMLLNPDDRNYNTVNTHQGLFQHKCLLFSIPFAPTIFQSQMEKSYKVYPKLFATYLDDVLITGKDDSKHLATLEKVFDQLY